MKNLIQRLAIALSLAVISSMVSVQADQTNSELDELFFLLQGSRNPSEASVLTKKIWQNWYQSDDPDIVKLLDMGAASMRRGELDDAVGYFSEIIEINPNFSEGWNRRATAYYMMGEFKLSTLDIAATLNLEPRHFGALSGQGMIYTRLNNRDKALEYYERALAYNPHLQGVKRTVDLIKKSIEKEVI